MPPLNSVPAGIVYIEPTSHTMFYSVVVPVASALAAGNCVILLVSTVSICTAEADQLIISTQLENNIRAVPSLLRKLLSSTLDADIFAITSSPVKDSAILSRAICVLQNGVQEIPRQNQLRWKESVCAGLRSGQ